VKGTFLAAIGIFELGSVICGAAPSSKVLIVGRAIAGIGVGGIFSGSLVIVAYSRTCRLCLLPTTLLLTRGNLSSSCKTTDCVWNRWQYVGYCFCSRPIAWWSFHRPSVVAMVFLHQVSFSLYVVTSKGPDNCLQQSPYWRIFYGRNYYLPEHSTPIQCFRPVSSLLHPRA